MELDKSFLKGNTSLLLLKLLDEDDMYGYQIIETLQKRSDNTFSLKAGTLYPLLHALEQQGALTSYEKTAENGKQRKYYSITKKGKNMLKDKQKDWDIYSSAINNILGGNNYAEIR